MIAYRTDFLKDIRTDWLAIAQAQVRFSTAEYIAKLTRESNRPTWITTAWDGARCVGTIMFWSAEHLTEAAGMLDQLGLDPARYIVRSNIYVHPDYQGQKISNGLYAAQNEHVIERGFVGGIGYGYETEAIASWAAARPGVIVTDLKDSNGYAVVLSELVAA